MSALPDVSVVVATHNRAERLRALLAGLRGQTLAAERFEVVVVDDASSDATQQVLHEERARGALELRSLRQPEPRGPAAARNRGWRDARAPVVAFTDDDCVPAAGWLVALLDASAQEENSIVRGATLPNPAEIDARDAYAKTIEIRHPSPHYQTCNVAYPRRLLERVGGFNEAYPGPAGEDSDLGWRAVEAGGKPAFAPDAVVHHAVFERGPVAALRDALLATEAVLAYKLNPGQREHLAHRLFFDRSHPLLAAAACGALLARRHPAAALLCLPYAHNLRRRRRAARAPIRQTPFFVLFDAVQTAAAIRGSARYGVLVL